MSDDLTQQRTKLDAMADKFAMHSGVPQKTPDQLQAMLASASPPVIVDTRNADEQLVSMLPHAITLDEFQQRRAELPLATQVRKLRPCASL